MTRIVHLIPSDSLGGVETAARVMAEADSLACDFRIVFIGGRSFARDTRRIIDGDGRSQNDPLAHLRAVRRILKLRPDVLICSLWRSVPIAIAVKRLRPQTKLVHFFHFEETTHRLDSALDKLAMRAADEFWADSDVTLKARRGASKTPGRVISFVTERRTPLASPRSSARFVSWGRLHPQKGLDRAIDLIAMLRARGVDATLEAWGPDNGIGDELRTRAATRGVTDHVSFPGPIAREAIPELASRNAFYLQLSRGEGMAMAVVEAMQLGLVPVVTAVGQMAHYVVPGQNGIIVDPDDLSSAADAITALVDDATRYEALSASARDHWNSALLYPEDVCAAAMQLASRNS